MTKIKHDKQKRLDATPTSSVWQDPKKERSFMHLLNSFSTLEIEKLSARGTKIFNLGYF